MITAASGDNVNRLDQVRWIDLHPKLDERGSLTAIEGEQTVPFKIHRVYFIQSTAPARAGHAHRDTEQLLIPVAGSCEVSLSDGIAEKRYVCDRNSRGLYIVPMLFIRVFNFSPDAVVLVLASTHYDSSRSIRTWAAYLTEAK